MWDWILAVHVPVCFTETGLVELEWGKHVILLRPGTQDFFIFREIFIDDVYETASINRPLDTVIDLGANAGFFSLAMRGKARRVIGVEPVEENYRHARLLLECNGENPDDMRQLAIADRADELLRIYRSDLNSGGHSTASQWVDKNSHEFEVAKTTTLERLIDESGSPAIDLLKCDVEGAEYSAFLAAPTYVLGKIRRIVMEVHLSAAHPPELLQRLVVHLEQSGFAVTLDGPVPELTKRRHVLMLTATREAVAATRVA